MHQLSNSGVVLACVCGKGFPFVVVIAGKGIPRGGWLADCSVVFRSKVLGVGWRMVSESIASWSLKRVQSELDFAANLTFEHETQRKEKKLK